MNKSRLMLGFLLGLIAARTVFAAAPSAAELEEARQWAAAKFEGKVKDAKRVATLEVIQNHDPVQKNARGDKPMHLGETAYVHGLFCHAQSEVVVHLAGPAERFTAMCGVDSNGQTSGGRGSVVFSVRVGGKDIWKSELTHEGVAPIAVDVPLNGTRDFALLVSDGGDGISCDQADWADAKIVYAGAKKEWLADLPLSEDGRSPYDSAPFFSFNYGGEPSSAFLGKWRRSIKSKGNVVYEDPATKLKVWCEVKAYDDFPTVEWTIHFKNEGEKDTPIISDIAAIDTGFSRGKEGEFTLYHNKGDNCVPDSYAPLEDVLGANVTKHLANTGGRPTQTEFPYFNIGWPGEGVIYALSWAGQWSTEFVRDGGRGLRVRGGQEQTHFVLHPGEEVRGPMVVLQFYKGDRMRAQNVWRAWMLAHNVPRPGGALPPSPELAACSSHQFGEMIHADTASQEFFIDKYVERGMKLDYWWMDAGWYWNTGGWPQTGTWEVDTNRFPGGLRPISDHAHAKGVNIIVWFEPERVAADTWLSKEHPEWIHGGAKGGLLDLGNAEARTWLTDHVDHLLTSEGIDLYRQDFNMDPLDSWRAGEAEDRKGIKEIRHVEGYFGYWDALRARHPKMLIDSCASGGRRNDLETLRRAVPLLRSDYIMEPTGNQAQTWAMSSWIPYYGTGTSKTDPYQILSVLCPHFTACWDMRDEKIDFAALSGMVAKWKDFAPYFMGDYYPLTNYTLDTHDWIAWQFHDAAKNAGMVQAFRRENSAFEAARFPIHGIDPAAMYHINDLNSGPLADISGQELFDSGVPISLLKRPSGTVITYSAK